MAVPEARINQLPDLSVAIEPYYGYDPKYRQLVIGEVRLSEAIAVHPYIEILLAKNRVREDDTHEPNNTTNLRELLLGNTEFTRGPRQENPYRNLSLAQYHDYGSWILYVCDKVNTNTMNNSANLWLGPSTNMLRKSGHVKKVSEFRALLGQRLPWGDRVTQMNEWELAAVMRQAAMTSAHRPTAKTFESPVSSGIDAPGYYDFQKYGISLPETLENAGFLEPLTWGITKYGEWSNLFIAVNGRTPTQKEMAPIANEGNGPSPTNATLRMFGDFRKFKKFAIQYSEARSHLLLNGVENRLRSGELPRNIVLDVGSGEELVRRTARFDVLNSLLPSNPLMESLKLCLYDVTDDELINYWSRHHTIPGWMIESAAWKINRLPELFPNGTLARALLIDDKK